ncbi:regulator of length of O-antigen component of lipopolysaccharide chains [Pseudomonas sp. 9AZ]|nr:regulator of length of O-antigen component of lipopolysaccharide chains [Pseudomonas sp. 9AZ]
MSDMKTSNSSQAIYGDEIDLVELFCGLWAQKWLIILVTMLCVIGAATYAFFTTPVYEARIAVQPPTLSDIAGFNQGRTGDKTRGNGLKPFVVDDVYAVFSRNLQSDSSKRKFFREVYLPSLDEAQRSGSRDSLYKNFNNKLSINVPDKNQPQRFSVAVNYHSPQLASAWAKEFIDQVAERSLTEMLENAERELAVQARNIEQQIKSEQVGAKSRRDDRIVQLQEALKVAEAIGLDNPPVITGRVSNESELSAFMDGSLMYMRGTKALRAEMQVLVERLSDDPFVPELRELEAKYQVFSSVSINPEKVAVFRQDGDIEVPDQPIKPKKALVLVLGVLLGGVLGVFAALIRLILIKRAARF